MADRSAHSNILDGQARRERDETASDHCWH
jgi:hypothetical protein